MTRIAGHVTLAQIIAAITGAFTAKLVFLYDRKKLPQLAEKLQAKVLIMLLEKALWNQIF